MKYFWIFIVFQLVKEDNKEQKKLGTGNFESLTMIEPENSAK